MKYLSQVSLNGLKAFEAVASYGGVSQAAEALHVSHSAVSHQVKQLEQSLGVSLLSGSRRVPSLTREGQQLAERLHEAFSTIEEGLASLQQRQQTSLDICCLPSFASRTLIPLLHEFYALERDVDVKIITNENSPAVRSGQYDIQIIALPKKSARHSVDVLLFEEALGLVLSPKILPSTISGQERPDFESFLKSFSFLLAKGRANVFVEFLAASELALATPAAVVDYEHYHFAIEAVLSGLGYCIAPRHLVARDIEEGRLIAPYGFYPSDYDYVARCNVAKSQIADRFLKWLKESAGKAKN